MKRTARQANVSKESFMTSEKSEQHQDNVSKEAFMTQEAITVENEFVKLEGVSNNYYIEIGLFK